VKGRLNQLRGQKANPSNEFVIMKLHEAQAKFEKKQSMMNVEWYQCPIKETQFWARIFSGIIFNNNIF